MTVLSTTFSPRERHRYPRMHFDIIDLQLFLKIAETGSLTQGAKEHSRSLSAASTKLKTLEQQLGARLFYRNPSGLSLTSAGKELLANARTIVNAYEITKKIFQHPGRAAHSHLRVLANAASISEIVPDLTIGLLKRNASVSIDVHPRNSQQAVKGILDHEADIALIAGDDRLATLNSIVFATDHLSVVYPPGHALADIAAPTLQDAARFPLLSIYGSTLYAFIQDHLRSLDLRGNCRVLLDSFEPIIRLIESGAGVAIIPESTALRFGNKYKIQSTKLADPWAFRERRVLFGEVSLLSLQARDFLNVLIEKYFDVQTGDFRLQDFIEPPQRPCEPEDR